MRRFKRIIALVLATAAILSSGISDVRAASEGWVKESAGWVYYSGGQKQVGWISDGGSWYYTDSDGVMKTGWVCDKGVWYYMRSSGAMATGWICDGSWYYMTSSGAMATGWAKAGGYWYHFDSAGKMETGWIEDGGKWYYLQSSGYMTQGWLKDGNEYYYCDRSSGAMRTDTTVNGIALNSDGAAEKTGYANEKIPVMIRAREVVASICNPDDSLASKQSACYTWVADYPYILRDYPVGDYYNKGYWSCYSAHYADNILNSSGSLSQPGAECTGEAAALGYLFNELNFGTVYLEHSSVHGWIEVNGLLWDPLNHEAKKNGQNWLGITPSAYGRPTSYYWDEI